MDNRNKWGCDCNAPIHFILESSVIRDTRWRRLLPAFLRRVFVQRVLVATVLRRTQQPWDPGVPARSLEPRALDTWWERRTGHRFFVRYIVLGRNLAPTRRSKRLPCCCSPRNSSTKLLKILITLDTIQYTYRYKFSNL